MTTLELLTSKNAELEKFEGKEKHTWCSGCGNFGIISALKRALVLEGITPDQALLCYDVGCNGNESDKINAYTIHGLHGRVIPLAAGASLANPKIEVIAQAGDGATFSEGINHLVHGVRNNYNITFICHNNSNYGLTIGQASSTTRKKVHMSASPDGVVIEPLNTMQFVLSLNPTFVARSFSGDIEHMTQMIQEGINHKGFSYVEIIQACPTFNKDTPQEWYWDKIKYLDEASHDKNDIWAARKVADNTEKDIAVGILYQKDVELDLESRLLSRHGYSTTLVEEVKQYDVSESFKDFI
ncbi:MAG: thiamine pyrophosphate-dependent enzyme [bacterium]